MGGVRAVIRGDLGLSPADQRPGSRREVTCSVVDVGGGDAGGVEDGQWLAEGVIGVAGGAAQTVGLAEHVGARIASCGDRLAIGTN